MEDKYELVCNLPNSYQISSKSGHTRRSNDVIQFWQWRRRWLNTTSGFIFPKVKIYPQTKLRRRILIHSWDITTSDLEKNERPPYWNSSLCDFDQIAVVCVLCWIKFPNFAQIRGGLMTKYVISRWQPQWRSTISDFVFNIVTLFQRSKSIRKPNFVDVT